MHLSKSSTVLDGLHTLAAGRPGVITAVASWWSGERGAREKVGARIAERGPLASLVGMVQFIAREAS